MLTFIAQLRRCTWYGIFRTDRRRSHPSPFIAADHSRAYRRRESSTFVRESANLQAPLPPSPLHPRALRTLRESISSTRIAYLRLPLQTAAEVLRASHLLSTLASSLGHFSPYVVPPSRTTSLSRNWLLYPWRLCLNRWVDVPTPFIRFQLHSSLAYQTRPSNLTPLIDNGPRSRLRRSSVRA